MKIGGIDAVEAVNVGKKVLLEMLSDLISELRPTMSLEELQVVYTKNLDKIILQEEQTNSTKFVGGEFCLNYIDEDHYDCAYKLFFMDKSKKIFEISTKSKPFDSSYLNSTTRDELKSEKTIKFEISEPSREARDKFNREKFES